MKKVSRAIQAKYMRAFIDSASEFGGQQIILGNNEIAKLDSLCCFSDVVSVLEGLGNVSVLRAAAGNILSIELTPQGRCYFERRADDRHRLIMNSIVIPVIVAIITTTVTVYILPSLGRKAEEWLENLQPHSQKP